MLLLTATDHKRALILRKGFQQAFAIFISNPKPVNESEPKKIPKKTIYQNYNKTLTANFNHLLPIHCKNKFSSKYTKNNNMKRMNSYELQDWVCVKCYLKQVPLLGPVAKFPFQY